jgi:hypothetical protein
LTDEVESLRQAPEEEGEEAQLGQGQQEEGAPETPMAHEVERGTGEQ